MDFDHVSGDKLFNISERVRVATEAALRAEICQVVCANCHRLRTYGPHGRDQAGRDSEEGDDHRSRYQAREGRARYTVPIIVS